ncbi:MAG: NTP pyrophosphohydrolase [Candidatus Peregrinibacteria bacterium Greene0416_62]|nr:MAG: NTP pyrophosphohydrolase [Candidatus Peregrinibacteria bacterium Greene0416_62]TSC99728.1 MAG: NTP pyrophosphohydrolase [Candidatus Peregrinibacteria bacterium Greene1014_49]
MEQCRALFYCFIALEELYSGHGWSVLLEEAVLPDGRTKRTPRVHRCDCVNIVAFSDPLNVLLLREYRPFYGEYIWMLPSGHVDKETDVTVAAQRELREETGFRARNLRLYCVTRQSEAIAFANHIFIASDLTKDPLKQDADEMIEVHKMPLEEAIQKVLESPVIHTSSAFALLRVQRDKITG